MNKTKITFFSAILVFALTLSASAAPFLTKVYEQGFENDTSGWLDSSSSWYGYVSQVPDGYNGIPSSEGDYFAIMEGDDSSAPFSRFDSYRNTWPGEWIAEIDVYLDPEWSSGEGFDYSVAVSGSDGNHQRDYIFHVGVVEDYDGITGKALLVNASNNADFTTNPYKLTHDNDGNYYEVEEAGWYTLQHRFYDDGGSLSVDLSLVDSGNILWTATRSNAADTIPAEVGGNRYAWFTHIDVENGIAVDAHELYLLDEDAPDVALTSPADNMMVSGMVEVRGSVEDDNPHHYWLVIQDSDGNTVAGPGVVNEDESFVDTSLFMWDTSMFLDGEYTIKLEARDANGNKDAGSFAWHTVYVDNVPDDKDDCKKDGWQNYGFKNQGQCVRFFETDKDSR